MMIAIFILHVSGQTVSTVPNRRPKEPELPPRCAAYVSGVCRPKYRCHRDCDSLLGIFSEIHADRCDCYLELPCARVFAKGWLAVVSVTDITFLVWMSCMLTATAPRRTGAYDTDCTPGPRCVREAEEGQRLRRVRGTDSGTNRPARVFHVYSSRSRAAIPPLISKHHQQAHHPLIGLSITPTLFTTPVSRYSLSF